MAKLPTLRNRRLQEIVTIMYKVKNNMSPSYIANFFTTNAGCHALKNSDFIIPRFNPTTYGKHSISYLGPTMWAKLSKDIRKSETLKVFKNCIRTMNLSDLISNNCQNCFLCSN